MIDSQTSLAFTVQENPGVFAVLLGSGVSRAAGIPTGWEITLDLIRRVAMAQQVPERSDWSNWYSDETGEEPDYSHLLDKLAATPEERRSILHGYIEPTEEDRAASLKQPTAAHRSIADLIRRGYIRVVITTNFDRLLETALRDLGVEPIVVSTVDDIAGAVPLIHSRCTIIKVHGDYLDTRIRNTPAELDTYPPEFDALIDRVIDEHGLIICGWSADWDGALRRAILRSPNRRFTTFWTSRSDIKGKAEEIVRKRGAKEIRVPDADALFSKLAEQVVSLEKLKKPNPLSADLAVSTAKRYAARAEHRIELHDLITNELELLATRTREPAFAQHEQPTDDLIRERAHAYEAASERLIRILAVASRWSPNREAVCLTALREISARISHYNSGFVAWIAMQQYPTLLAFYAMGLAAHDAGEWRFMQALFACEVLNRRGERRSAVRQFLPSTSDLTQTDTWVSLLGKDRHTPMSEYLIEFLTPYVRDTSISVAGFPERFDEFEFVAALCFAHQGFAPSVISGEGRFWVPVGRLSWMHENREAMFRKVREAGAEWPPFKAGMFGPKFDHFQALLARVDTFMNDSASRRF